MAKRRQIRDAVYDELVSAATGSYTVTFDDGSTVTQDVTESDVNLFNPEGYEDIPGVLYAPQSTRHREFNGVGTAPDYIKYDDLGNVEYSQWTEHIESFYLLYVRAQTPAHREPIYESVYRQFEKYEHGNWPANDVHDDVEKVWVEESNPANSPDEEDAIWGDQIALYVRWKRKFILESGGSTTMDEAVGSIENIAQVNIEADLDTDNQTSGFNFTIN